MVALAVVDATKFAAAEDADPKNKQPLLPSKNASKTNANERKQKEEEEAAAAEAEL